MTPAPYLPPLPIDDCPKCATTYLCCPACGASGWQQTRADEGETCKCGHGTVEMKTSRFCCHRYNHHIGTTCPHCGLRG